ncbi:nucleocapsid protein [Snakehead rhabdovirus]|uniref:Nucleoprotein n=1 Tax=Snakehead rhabdovirus TaxID=103603 RepID=NCAP_SHRV|nr:nucleocapsid protein [Snakehead virus]Q9QJT9.1 RecName: Full=Nucleoprotein; Short=NP; AltName: Full=Nucleocapsid protein; Short=Protein N [Snakehead virus]AAD56766.1 nucleocapsid protein [Snakehead virus]
MAFQKEFFGLRDVKVDLSAGEGLDFDPSEVELTVYRTGADTDGNTIIKALAAVGGPKTNEALSVLLAFVTLGTDQDEYETRIKILKEIGFSVKEVPMAKDASSGIEAPLENVAALVKPETVYQVIRGVLYTCALFVKYNVEKMQKYIKNKLPALATSYGVPELEEFPTESSALKKLASCIRPGQRITNALYAFLLVEMARPETQQGARALAAMRINGTGMTMVGLFTQAAKNLGATPSDLLEDLCMRSLVDSARRIVRLMVQVSQAETIQARYAVMMSRMLNENYFKAYGLNDNSRISAILVAVNGHFSEDTIEALEGIKVSAEFADLARRIAIALIEKYDNASDGGEGASEIIKSAVRGSSGAFKGSRGKPQGRRQEASGEGDLDSEDDDDQDYSKYA